MATATRRRKGGKKEISPAKQARIDAAKERDAEITARVDRLLSDDDAAARLVEVLGDTPGIARFSTRNQLLLVTEADARGMKLTAVASYKTWQMAGRQVRKGEHGLTIVRPVGRKGEEVADDESAADRAAENKQDEQDEQAKRPQFRGMTVFDVSQTDDLFDGDEVETDPESGERLVRVDKGRMNPQGKALTESAAKTARAEREEEDRQAPARLLESLREAAESHGYTVATGDTAEIDTDAKEITLPAELTPDTMAPVIDVARTLAIGRVRAREARKAARAAEGTPRRPGRVSVGVSAEDGDVETFTVI